MYVMRATEWVSGDRTASFYYTNAVVLTVFAAAAAAGIWLLAGRRALWFALAPTLLIYGTINWDLVAVALATLALVTFASRRDGWTGVLLGLGAAAKFYPVLLVVPLFLQGIQDREPDRSVRVLWWTVGTWVAVNLPFAVAAPGAWFEFFRFNSSRVADFDSLWYVACRHWDPACISTGMINAWTLVLFIAAFGLLLFLKTHRTPEFPRWTLGFPMLACFLLFNKVYSPQYSLWLLPWFALVVPRWTWFAAFEAADVAVFVTRFRYFFPVYVGGGSLTPEERWFELAVLVRAAVLVCCLVIWIRRDAPRLVLGARGWHPLGAAGWVLA